MPHYPGWPLCRHLPAGLILILADGLMIRSFLTVALLAALAAAAHAALIPAEWRASDYPSSPPDWYGVEVAQFPSAILAKSVEDGLEQAGWGPVFIQKEDGGPASVIIGEVDDAGRAWFLRDELARQKVATGKIVRLDSAGEPRGFTGPASKPFTAGFDMDPSSLGQLSDEMRSTLDGLVVDADSETAHQVEKMLGLLADGKFADPGVAHGAVAAAKVLWDRRVSPDATLYLASRVASGAWPLPPEDAAVKQEARNLVYRLLHGHKRDWRGAWQAARYLERTAENDSETRATNMLRKAALRVDLVERGTDPKPSFASIREHLRRAYEIAPEESRELRAQIEIVYLQTFAWEGNWERVEPIAKALAARYDDQPAYTAMARILHAQSLERVREYKHAQEILNEVAAMKIPRNRHLRFGMKTLNPADVAAEKLDYFRGVVQTEAAATAPARAKKEARPESGARLTEDEE